MDKASSLDEVSNATNIVLVSPGQEDAASVFGGDVDRFARESEEAGVLVYDVVEGFSSATISFFTKNDPDWQLEAVVGDVSVLTLTEANVTAAIDTEVSVHRVEASCRNECSCTLASGSDCVFSAEAAVYNLRKGGMCISVHNPSQISFESRSATMIVARNGAGRLAR